MSNVAQLLGYVTAEEYAPKMVEQGKLVCIVSCRMGQAFKTM